MDIGMKRIVLTILSLIFTIILSPDFKSPFTTNDFVFLGPSIILTFLDSEPLSINKKYPFSSWEIQS